MIGVDDGDVRIYVGDAVQQLREVADESVQCVITSPPFWGLRDYGTATWVGGDDDCDHKALSDDDVHRRYLQSSGLSGATPSATQTAAARVYQFITPCPKCGAVREDQQIGLEATPDEWVSNLVAVFRECRRVLRPDGVMFVEVGDTYASGGNGNGAAAPIGPNSQRAGRSNLDQMLAGGPAPGCKAKDLVGAPWLLAFALRADGWYLRADIIWHRPNPMPESITDRPTKSHSYVFLFAKSARYYWDMDAIREPLVTDGRGGFSQKHTLKSVRHEQLHAPSMTDATVNPDGANARSVWTIATTPTPFAHFAVMPTTLVERCIAAGTSEYGACRTCGAPWRRRHDIEYDPVPRDDSNRQMTAAGGVATGGEGKNFRPITDRRLTWEPSCRCHGAGVRPCVVLDPFMGSGTVALIARRMGRDAVGVELNPDYLDIARGRLAQLSLFAAPAPDADTSSAQV